MTKYSLIVLMAMSDNDITVPSKAVSVGQVLSLIKETERKAYSTTYRHLCRLVQLGYAQYGLDDGLASTYYITDTGKMFCNAQI